MIWIYLKWLMVFLVWASLTFGLVQEILHLRRHIANPVSAQNLADFLRMLHLRNIQVWVLLSLLFVITAIGDIRFNRFVATTTPLEDTGDAEPIPTPSAAAPVVTGPVYDNAFAKATGSTLPFSDITEFNEKDSKQQAYIDWLKQHYEAWFVTYYYLHKCDKAGAADIAVIDTALQKELRNANADNKVRDNILLAAAGSYNELYRDIPCDETHLSATKASYDANMQQIQSVPASSAKPDRR